MQTYSTNEVSITRGNPTTPDSSIPVMMLQLEDRRRREPPNDGLVSHLFSRLAAMLAIDQAAELARQNQLPPPATADVETNALKRAAGLESCKLSWNATKCVYELRHPSLHRRGALHLSVSTPTSQPRSQGQQQAPTILVTAPLPKNAVDVAAAASPRTSTLPLSGSEPNSDEALASLDLRTMTLVISASAINNTIPSLYAIDSIVAAILAVAVSDLSTNPVLADMPFYDPTKARSQAQTQSQSHLPMAPEPTHTNKPKLFATLAERDDHENNNTNKPPQTQPQTQPQSQTKVQYKWLQPWYLLRSKLTNLQFKRNRKAKTKAKARARTKPHNSPTSPAVEEIDLEQYGISTSQSTNNKKTGVKADNKQEMPGLARGLIKLISWGFRLAFWALTVAFRILGWVFGVVFRIVTGRRLE